MGDSLWNRHQDSKDSLPLPHYLLIDSWTRLNFQSRYRPVKDPEIPVTRLNHDQG